MKSVVPWLVHAISEGVNLKKYPVQYIYTTTRNALFRKLPSGVNDLPEIHGWFPNSGKMFNMNIAFHSVALTK